ncbi:hypothetical protein [Methylophaga sp.]|mgnify:CR=1 FL=1|jgi:hypothetical protein|uniref:hypothetical protein n=1 Tax=Methylophaga sp. TaxID=2024840 RepID=UPI00272569D9|nr:hypothetical protein [Methylophaga sp.]MDO8827735.1 hypothetical protein [Methylophaga sp.]
MLEQNIIKLAKARLETLKTFAEDDIDFFDVYVLYSELKGLVDLRFLEPSYLSDDTVNVLILIDNLASLTMRSVHPETVEVLTEQGARLDEYMAMSERELADLIFKQGGRFNNPDAVSVALHRKIVDDIINERVAYERISQRESQEES